MPNHTILKRSFVNRHLFIVGAQRSGTSYLWNTLEAHPDVFMAKPLWPEPKYFLDPNNVAAGYDAYHERYFHGVAPDLWLGEKGTSYIEREDVAYNIKSMIPGATIIVMLRDPVERAISNYYFTKEHGMEPYDIEYALLKETERLPKWDPKVTSASPHAYMERGKYMQYLEFWERHVGRERLILLVTEQFIGNKAAIRDLYLRLGLNGEVLPPNLNERVNAGCDDRMEYKIPDSLGNMLAEQFRPWNIRLAERFGLDLSCWRGMS